MGGDNTGFFPDFFLEKNLGNRGKYPVPLGKNTGFSENPVEKIADFPNLENPALFTGFYRGESPRYSAPKRHSSLFLRTFLCRITHGPHPRPGHCGQAQAPIPARPAILARHSRPDPAQRSGTCDRIFPSVPFFFRDMQDFFLA